MPLVPPSMAYARSNVVNAQVSGTGYDCRTRTRVQLEVTFVEAKRAAPEAAAERSRAPLTLDAELAGCTQSGARPTRYCTGGCSVLGLLVGRNATTAQPLVATFREYNARQYWAVLDRLELEPLAQPPQRFPLMDNLAGDDDVGMWADGIGGLAKLGFHGVVVPKPNLTTPLLRRAMGNTPLTTGPGRFLPVRAGVAATTLPTRGCICASPAGCSSGTFLSSCIR